MNMPIRTLLALAVLGAAYGCAQMAGIATLRGSDAATADQAPPTDIIYAGRRPGSQKAIERSFKEQPPLVPHAIENFDEITVADNQCLECHSPETADKKQAPKVGDTHLAKGALRMERYQCNTCHVPQVNAPPLVRSTFATR